MERAINRAMERERVAAKRTDVHDRRVAPQAPPTHVSERGQRLQHALCANVELDNGVGCLDEVVVMRPDKLPELLFLAVDLALLSLHHAANVRN